MLSLSCWQVSTRTVDVYTITRLYFDTVGLIVVIVVPHTSYLLRLLPTYTSKQISHEGIHTWYVHKSQVPSPPYQMVIKKWFHVRVCKYYPHFFFLHITHPMCIMLCTQDRFQFLPACYIIINISVPLRKTFCFAFGPRKWV